jgi:hypothetical protein
MINFKQQVSEIMELIKDHEKRFKTRTDAICIEEFERHLSTKYPRSLWVLNLFTGYLYGRLEAARPNAHIFRISKGTAPKLEGAVLARAYGFSKLPKDASDALHLGILAGFNNS